MKQLRFKKIDAFASSESAGNPAAVIYLNDMDELTDREKMQIAKELKGFVSEVGFVSPGSTTDYRLRYFSSEREVPFCGHATIAILNDIVSGDITLQMQKILTIATRTDELKVENRFPDEKSVYISAPAPRFFTRKIGTADIAAALNCSLGNMDPSCPIQIINAGLETLIVPVTGLAAILSVNPDIRILKAFCLRNHLDIVLLYSSEVALVNSSYRTRVFAPTFGYLEDPATGSGNSAFGYYLLANDLWNGENITIEQNGYRNAPNFIRLFSQKDESGDSRIWFGGGAITRIDGQYSLK